MLIYGMGEKPIMQLAQRLNKGELIGSITDLPQTVFLTSNTYPDDSKSITLHSYNDCLKNPSKLGDNFRIIEEESNKMIPCRLIEPYGESSIVVNPPYPIATPNEMDAWWDLPYVRAPHARYKGKKIPAWEMIKFSVNIHRGCFGGCSFCTISAHQGKFVSSRSEKSILKEVDRITKDPEFKGYLSDLGGPSANMYMMQGKNLSICAKCKKPSCIYPSICSNLNTNHEPLLKLYQKVRSIPKVKKAFIGSGIRYDLFADWSNPVNRQYFDDVVRFHVSGRLKVAPEHTEDTVLKYMRKPSFKLFEELKVKFDTINRKFSLNQQLIPYFISSHPGCTLEHMNSLAKRMEKMRIHPEQVQDFTPTPMTLASTIFYTGIDPYTGKPVFVERSKEGKLKQRENFFWYKKSPAKRFESGKRGNIPYRKRKA
jgi:uncharacterized radical SAM protein YgiQ